MGIKSMTPDQFLAFLKKQQGEMSLRTFATDVLKVSPAYLSDIYNGRREPGESVTSVFGIRRQVISKTRYVQTPSKEDE